MSSSKSLVFFGTSAAVPSVNRRFSCIGVEDGEAPAGLTLLLDCGDGAIGGLLEFGADVNSISSILISHYHSDHITGLTQIIETMGIRCRSEKLSVFGPPGLKEYLSTIQRITNVASHRKFRLEITELSKDRVFNMDGYSVRTFEMNHTIPCLGYRLVLPGGAVISYTGDTMPCDALNELGKKADVFIHEATFLEKDIALAKSQKHSTAAQAGEVANQADAKQLVLTHVNDDRETPPEMIAEASSTFSKVIVAYDGLRLKLV